MVKGANTHAPQFGLNLPAQVQNAHKVWHIEVGRDHSDLIKRLVEVGRTQDLSGHVRKENSPVGDLGTGCADGST